MLILGSYGFKYPSMREKLGKIIQGRTGKMLIIPLASAYGAASGEAEKEGAAALGFCKDDIYVFDSNRPEECLGMQFNYIVVLGGNTFQLLYYVKQFGLDAFIRQQAANGAVYLGFSAGAYLACPNIEYVKLFDDDNHITDGDYAALGLIDSYVLCHFDTRGYADIRMCRSYIGEDADLITINNDQLVIL